MKFGDLKVGTIFFEGNTGEYYKKMNERESIVIAIDTKKEYADLVSVFPKPHIVEVYEE